MNFNLTKVLDKTRTDYKIINENYHNVVLFWYKQKIYMFNFVTCFFYEVVEIDFFHSTPKKGYKIVKVINQYIPETFNSYNFNYNPKRRENAVKCYKINTYISNYS